MWRNGLYTMRAINACFGGKYPEKPLFEVGESKESSERQEHDGYIQNKKLKKLEKLWSCNYKSWKDSSGEQSVKKSYLSIKWRAAQYGLLSFLLP